MPVIVDEVSVESVPPAQAPTTRSADNPAPRQPLAPNAPVAIEIAALLGQLHERSERVRAH
jgi:hypothetical protein